MISYPVVLGLVQSCWHPVIPQYVAAAEQTVASALPEYPAAHVIPLTLKTLPLTAKLFLAALAMLYPV